MDLLTLLYILCVFVIFTPGIFFSLGKKGYVKSVFIHGLLFTFIVYISLEFILHKKIKEGHNSSDNIDAYTLKIGDLGSVADKLGLTNIGNGNSSGITSSGGTSTSGNVISSNSNNCCNDLKNSFENLSQKITDYQTTSANFNCTYKVENSDFSSPVVSSQTQTFQRNSQVNSTWSTINGAIINKNNDNIVSSVAPLSIFNLDESSEGSQQSAVLQSNMDIYTTVNLNVGNYTLSFDAISANSSSITIKLDKDNNPSIVNINATPTWTQITTPLVSISNSGSYILTLKNEGNEDQSFAFKNIIITKKE